MGGIEPPTCGLWVHRSNHLSYITVCSNFPTASTSNLAAAKCPPLYLAASSPRYIRFSILPFATDADCPAENYLCQPVPLLFGDRKTNRSALIANAAFKIAFFTLEHAASINALSRSLPQICNVNHFVL
jgi:hypothetical protein